MRNGLEESAGRLFVKWHQLVTSRGHAVKLITKPEFGQGWSNKTIIWVSATGSQIRSIQPTVLSRLLMRDLSTVLGICNALLFGDSELHPLRLSAGRETE